MTTVAEQLVRTLRDAGVQRVYGVVGDSLNPIVDAIRRTEGVALFGTWLVGKDWRDLFPSKRDTGAWSLLPHRVPRDKR